MKPMVYTKHLGKDRHKLEMAPMVDVVFQLLIFFLVATQVRPTEADFKSMLPPSEGPADPQDKETKEKVDIYLSADAQKGCIIHNGGGPSSPTLKDYAALYNMMSELTTTGRKVMVVLNADSQVKFKYITEALDAVMGAGVDTVTFAKSQQEN